MEFPRWGYAVLAAVSFGVGFVFAAGFLADLYAQIASEQRFREDASSTRWSAAREAMQLQPWRPGNQVDFAWAAATRGDLPQARRHFRRAIQQAPASGYLWLEYAQALARARRFDAEYLLAIRRASGLSPNAAPVRLVVARMGALHWAHGGEEDRTTWAQNMGYALRTAPGQFLGGVLKVRREDSFCGNVGAEFGLSRWCFGVQAARQLCDSIAPDGKGAAMEQCVRLGLITRRRTQDGRE